MTPVFSGLQHVSFLYCTVWIHYIFVCPYRYLVLLLSCCDHQLMLMFWGLFVCVCLCGLRTTMEARNWCIHILCQCQLPLCLCSFCFWGNVPNWTWNASYQLNWLASTTCIHLQQRLQAAPQFSQMTFMWILESRVGSSCRPKKSESSFFSL